MKSELVWRHSAAQTAAWMLGALLAVVAVAAAADARRGEAVTVIEHRTEAVPGMGRLEVHVWTDGAAVQVAALDERGAMVVLREGAMHRGSGTGGTALIRGTLPAMRHVIPAHGTAMRTACTEHACAEALAGEAAVAVRAADMVEHTGQGTDTMLVRACPVGDGSPEGVAEMVEEQVMEAVQAQCRWLTLEGDTSFAIRRPTEARLSGTRYEVRYARWRPVHGGR